MKSNYDGRLGMMKLKIENIKIGSRIRQRCGDLSQLKQSIQEIGLLNPIVVNEQCELVSGFRRLEACRQMGWNEITAKIIDIGEDKVKKLDLEFHENLGRLNLNEEEQQNYNKIRHELLHPPKTESRFFQWLKRIWEIIKSIFLPARKDALEEFDFQC